MILGRLRRVTGCFALGIVFQLLLYKQRESWNTVYNARKVTCNLPQANATCNL